MLILFGLTEMSSTRHNFTPLISHAVSMLFNNSSSEVFFPNALKQQKSFTFLNPVTQILLQIIDYFRVTLLV